MIDPSARYRVTTWDVERNKFTPQDGVSPGPHSPEGLRAALRELKDLGYDCFRDDNSILVERVDRRARLR